eukprot:6178756-Pleurochrysis_carterae.AAC.2
MMISRLNITPFDRGAASTWLPMVAATEQSEGGLSSQQVPSLDELITTRQKPTTSADIVAHPVGAHAAIHFRESVNKNWSPGALLRQAAMNCIVHDRTGKIEQHSVPCGLNDDGTPVDNGVTSEWTLILSSKVLVHHSRALARIKLP